MSESADHLSRPKIDPLYQKGAEAVYNSYREASVEAAKVAAGYGKWLVSSILLLHSGAIAGLLTFMGTIAKSNRFDPSAYAAAIWWFVYGIITILFCGFATWINWKKISEAYNHYVQPWMLVDPSRFPKGTAPNGWLIFLSYWLAIISGWLSVGCLLRGAFLVSRALGA